MILGHDFFEESFIKTEIFKQESSIRDSDILAFSETMNGYFNIVTNLAWIRWNEEMQAHADWYKNDDPLAFEWAKAGYPDFEADFYTSAKSWVAAKAQAVPETHILVERSKIETWWQDAEEPENFASDIKDLPSLGHYLTGDEIMEITEHHTIHLPSKTIYGVWVDKDGDKSFCTGTMEECLALTSSESGAEG